MTAIVETSTYTETITQLEITDLVLGGVGGPSNRALVELTNRTKWLYDRIASLTEQPLAALPYPTIATTTNKLTVTRTTGTAGGRVSIGAGNRLTVAEVVVSAKTGRLRTFTTSAYTSSDLLVSSTYYLRAQVDSGGALAIYVQRGTDSDPIPASFIGTPDAASGGGFDSTKVDMLIAKVVTGVAGSLPTVTALANAATLLAIGTFPVTRCTYLAQETEVDALTLTPAATMDLNWARIGRVAMAGIGGLDTQDVAGSNPHFGVSSTRYQVRLHFGRAYTNDLLAMSWLAIG